MKISWEAKGDTLLAILIVALALALIGSSTN